MATIEGTGGPDNLSGSSADDSITGLDGADTIDGKGGADTIDGGGGDDTIKGGDQNDTISGGSGNDTIDAKKGDDIVDGGAGNDSIDGVEGLNTIHGGEGDDFIRSGTGSSTVHGNEGADTIIGEGGANVITGGADNDSINSGGGDDTVSGGTGDDTITVGGGDNTVVFRDGDGADTITDFDRNRDIVALDSAGVIDFADVQARLVDLGSDSRLDLDDGSSIFFDGMKVSDFSAANFTFGSTALCLEADTSVETDRGALRAAELAPGDRVLTSDGGEDEVIWVWRRRIKFGLADHHAKPVLIKKGALGRGAPSRDLILSPQHRIATVGPNGDLKTPVLIAAKEFIGLPGIRRMEGRKKVDYATMLTRRHQVILAAGATVETLWPGPMALQQMSAEERLSLSAALRAAGLKAGAGYGDAAAPILQGRAARELLHGPGSDRRKRDRAALPA